MNSFEYTLTVGLQIQLTLLDKVIKRIKLIRNFFK